VNFSRSQAGAWEREKSFYCKTALQAVSAEVSEKSSGSVIFHKKELTKISCYEIY